MSRIDVIVPCYRYAHYLRQCVESVLDQSHGDLRVLIIDDCSPDHTEELARELVARDDRVAYRRHEVNRGHIATYNEGLQWSDGDYVLLLSADDLLTPGVLSRAVKLLDDHPSVGFAHGGQIRLHTDWPMEPVRSAPDFSWEISEGIEFLTRCCEQGNNPVATPTVVIRTPLLRRVGGYRADLPHTADMELWLRLAVHAPVGWVDADQAYKRVHDSKFDRGDVAGCQQLLTLALSLDPSLPLQPRWTRLALKRGMGPRVWGVVRPFADLLRVPFRATRTVVA